MADQPVFSADEVRALLRRATEMQAAQERPVSAGLSLDEVQQVAQEVGIDPHFVTAAMAEQAQAPPASSLGQRLVGGATHIHRVRVLPAAVTEGEAMQLISLARKAFGSAGTTTRLGQSLDGTHRPHPNREAHLTLTPGEDHITVSVSYRFPDMVGGLSRG